MKKHIQKILFSLVFALCFIKASAQSELIPISNDINNRIDKNIYFSGNERSHTAMRPFIVGDAIDSAKYSSLLSPVPLKDWQTKSWLARKIFAEHLIQLKRNDFELTADFLPDLSVGRQDGRSLSLNTRGFEIKGVVGSKKLFAFSTYLYENQATFANYITNFVNANQVVPGQAVVHNTTIKNSFDYAYSGGTLSFTPSTFFKN